MAHPQINSLIEVTNQVILKGLKKQVVGVNGTWVDKPPSILWAS